MALRKLLSKVTWAIFKRETVGIDVSGNKYYRVLDKDLDGKIIERRMVKYRNEEYDPLTVPPEWLQWLQKTRETVPNSDEIDHDDAVRKARSDAAAAADTAAAEAAFRYHQQQQKDGGARDSGSEFTQQLGSETNK